MAVNGYVTVPQFKAWRGGPGDTVDDVVIDESIGAASRGIDNFCNTRFWQTAAGTNRRFDTCDSRLLRIGDAVAVTQVATDKDGDGVFEVVWAATDYQLLPLNPAAAPELEPFTKIHAVGTLTFPQITSPTSRHGRVQITGTWGWPFIPSAVRQACLLVTNRLVKRRASPEGVAGLDEFGTVRISSRDDPDAVRYLTPYKTSRRAGGWAIA
jgi:hypothetical protein